MFLSRAFLLPAGLATLLMTSSAPLNAAPLGNTLHKNSNSQKAPIIAIANSEEEQAKAFVSSLTDRGIGFLQNDSLSRAERKAEFRSLLESSFDLKTIARFALGRYWRQSSDSQKDEYLKLFEDMIVEVYSRRFGEYDGQKLAIEGVRAQGKADYIVHSAVEQQSGPDVRVDWRVRKKKSGDFKVIDVIVEGVSMSLTQRSDFASVIQRGGGDVDVLIAHLRSDD